MDDLVSTEWLAERLGEPGLVVIDASAHLPDAGRDARAEFEAAHIAGARFLDLDTLKDFDSPVPAALPTAEQFAARIADIGVNDGDRVVIYDDSGVKTSARAWFIFRMHGMREVALLDGGLGKWRAEGRPLESGAPQSEGGHVTATPGPGTVRSKPEILANIGTAEEQLLDARKDLDRHLRPYRGKMSAEQLSMLEKQYLERIVLESAGLPRLSLFYMR